MSSAAHTAATDGRLVLALDQGTTSSRAIIFQEDGTIVSVAQRPVTPTYPHPGWVNQDAKQLWETTLKVAQIALTQAQLTAEQIAAIGITNQRETTILWDRASGEPVAPAISWQSRQTAPLVEAIRQRGMAAAYQHITGLVPDAYFSATKIAALLDAYPDLRHRAEAGEIAFGTVDSWLIWNLSGGKAHVTDVTNASRTMLYDLRKLDWSSELLRDLNIPREILPTVLPSAAHFCDTDPVLLGATIPVTGIAGDQQAALFGQACSEPGEAKNTYGTGSFVLLQTGTTPRPSAHQLLTTIAWQLGPEEPAQYALEGSIFVTGAAVQWLRDGLGIIRKAPEVEALAASVPDAHGVVFVPALTGLGAPHWDPNARGTIIGITRGTTAAHIARATLEAIAFQTRDVVDAMTADAGVPLTELRVDGGASQNDLLMQFQADILGVPVVRPKITETTALGAAGLARVGADIGNLEAHRTTMRTQTDRVFEPTMSADERDTRYATWLRAVERAKDWGLDA